MVRCSLTSLLLLSLSAAPLVAGAGCSVVAGDDSETSEQANTAEDLALAQQILTLLGGPNGKCKGCHTATSENIRVWGKSMQTLDAACFAPAGLAAMDRVDCMRAVPSDPTSAFSAHKLGLYAAGATLPEMETIFQSAFPAPAASTQFASFQQKVAMPRGRTPISAADFAKVKGWVLRGMPQLDQAITLGAAGDAGADASSDADTDGEAGANGCVESTTPALQTHLAQMQTDGWGARLADLTTPMFGCAAGESGLTCLGTLPEVTADVGATGVVQKVRKLRQLTLASHYWVRSSADGRWVGFGFNPGAKIVDLSKPETAAPITIGADYDPFFLPSNDGFAYAGADSDGAIHVCRQSLLADVAANASPSVSLDEPKCSSILTNQDVYQSIGTALDGTRYFVTVGDHENDDGGNQIHAPLPAAFGPNAHTKFVPMVNDGTKYRAEAAINVTMPGEGDVMLSPSTKMLVARYNGGTKQGGYRVHAVDAHDVAGALTVQAPLRAQICMKGAKATFSFDERFLVTHQYVDTSEPDQTTLPPGSSNIMIADLKTGAKVRLTKMGAGQYALYPHFRADGWLYFLVRDMNAHVEYVAATDVAIRMGAP